MAPPKYRYTWSELAYLAADHMNAWRAFDGWCGSISFVEDYVGGVDEARGEHDVERDHFRVFYAAEHRKGRTLVCETIPLERVPVNYGGRGRVYFRAPCCGRRVRQVALLPEGGRCGQCGLITWDSHRKGKMQRLVYRAGVMASRLELDNWFDTPTHRPKGMRRDTFERLADRHAEIVGKAHARVAPRLRRAAEKGPDALLLARLRAGL